MSKRTFYLLGMLLTIIITTILQYVFCCNCSKAAVVDGNDNNSIVTKPMVKEATLLPFVVKDAYGDLSLNINDNFNFKESSLDILKPISDDVDAGVLKLNDYLTANKGKKLSIIGYYTNSEKNNSAFPNLGLARANSVKNYFVGKGVHSNVIDTFGELKDDMIPDSLQVYHGPVSFDILRAKVKEDNKDDELNALLADIKSNPLILYFDTNKASVGLTASDREKFAKIAKYLDKNEKASCLVVGHTDNTGSVDVNQKLGKQRANFGKQYLVKNAILANRITTISKGDTEPVADNATEEGRSKNRRTVVTIK